jgi:L-ascorbate metabolism protein UlaG (beta-lactamase superfamily)
MKKGDVEINWLGQSGFKIKNSKIIYIDPYNIPDSSEKADIILITHSHYDHCSVADIAKIIKSGTKIIVPPDCQSKITHFRDENIEMQIIEVGDEIKFNGFKIIAFPSYNIGKPFHEKSEGWMGYVISYNNTIIYHAGDTDLIPEMQKLTGYGKQGIEFIALLPIGGKFTMNAEEAAKAASIIKPTIAIPMHYGAIIGAKEDAQKFIELCEENGVHAEII